MGAAKPDLTGDIVAQKLQDLKPRSRRAVGEISETRWAYREQASVRVCFDMDELRPLKNTDPIENLQAIQALVSDTTVYYDEKHRPHFMLKNEIRKETLKRLAERGALEATVKDNRAAIRDTLLEIYIAYILHQAPPVEEQNLDQLSASLQVVEWLDGIIPDLPPADLIRRQIDRERLIKPFRYLTGDHFRGRRKELERLRNYVGVLPTDSKIETIRRGVRQFFSLQEKPPLLIYGPGGMGKSTLVAKFILEHTQLPDGQQFPFIYLDFDRPDLIIEEPLTLLLEAVRQLSIQYPINQARWERVRRDWQRRMERSETELYESASQVNISGVSFRRREWERYFSEFEKLLISIEVEDQPLLLVLDTFEEVQYRSQAFVNELWLFLNQLQEQVPRLRTVLAGRALVENFKTEELLLDSLDEEAAQGFLLAHGISNQKLAKQIVAKVGRSPLSLILAAELLSLEDTSIADLRNLNQSNLFFFKQVQENLIQGQLYRRILNHIHDERVRKLAHPGLVLRRVTPELILNVLSKPCSVDVPDLAAAEDLFNEFRREVSLVIPSEDNSLRHRTDVRRVMLDLLRQDEPAKVEQIHRLAVAYYQRQEGPLARAEEIYHRLSLDENPRMVDERWMAGVEIYLRGVLEELPAKAQTYLASKLGLELPEAVWAEADLQDWEQHAARQAREFLALNKPAEALKILAERRNRTNGSPLPLIQAQALYAQGKLSKAREAAAKGVDIAAPNSPGLLELLQFIARLDRETGQFDEARKTLVWADTVAERLGDDLNRLEISLNLLRLSRRNSAPDSPELAKCKQNLLQIWNRIPDDVLVGQAKLLRDVPSEIGVEEPEVVKRVVRLVGLGTEKPSNSAILAQALATWDRLASQESGEKPGRLARLAGVLVKSDISQAWKEFVDQEGWSLVSRAVSALLGSQPLIVPVISALVEIIQSRQLLTDIQAAKLRQLLVAAFPTYETLRSFAKLRLEVDLSEISTSKEVTEAVFDLINWAESHGRLNELVQAALVEPAETIEVRQFAENIGWANSVHVSGYFSGANIAIGKGASGVVNNLRRDVSQVESAVCRVEIFREGNSVVYATGFLVSPGYVLTAYNVLVDLVEAAREGKQVSEKIALRFDYKASEDGKTLSQGQVYLLAEDWLVDSSPIDELDFALLRVDGTPGTDPPGGLHGSPPRGWINMAPDYKFTPGDPLVFLHFPAGRPLQVDYQNQAILQESDDGRRVFYHFDRQPGSSGAPCLNPSLDVVALHSRIAQDAQTAVGIPMGPIVRQLEDRRLWPFPPAGMVEGDKIQR